MANKITVCPGCLETDPIITGDGVGVGGTYYGSSYSFHSEIEIYTQCCTEHAVYVIDTRDIDLAVALRYLRRYGQAGPATEFIERVELTEKTAERFV